jgi:hypothetical protein
MGDELGAGHHKSSLIEGIGIVDPQAKIKTFENRCDRAEENARAPFAQDDTALFCGGAGGSAIPPMRDKAAHEWGTQIMDRLPA